MPGTLIGHYRLEALLGRGGMGEVYRGVDLDLGRPVAIKLLPLSGAVRRHSVERFFREARAASALNHPNIVTIHEAGTAPSGAHYIVQELVDGSTLRALMERGMAVDWEWSSARWYAGAGDSVVKVDRTAW